MMSQIKQIHRKIEKQCLKMNHQCHCYIVFKRLEFIRKYYKQTAQCKAIITKSEPQLKKYFRIVASSSSINHVYEIWGVGE